MSSKKMPETPIKEPLNTAESVETKHIEMHGGAREQMTTSCLDAGLIGSFQNMTERGKEIIGGAYKKLYDVPVVNHVVGKMGIAYKSFWLDRHEKKAVKIKGKMDGFDMAVSGLDQVKQSLSADIENLKRQNIPGSEALQLKLKVLDKKMAEMHAKKDREQTKFEVQENGVKQFTNERDAIADKLIGRYEEVATPLEHELGELQHGKDHIEMEFAVARSRHRQAGEDINRLEQQKTKMEEGLRHTGMSERAVKKFEAVKAIDDILATKRADIRLEKEQLTKRRNAIEEKIAKVDKKANPYRDKRDEFVRAKQGRPIDMGVYARSRETNTNAHEDVDTHYREERPEQEAPAETDPENNQSREREVRAVETEQAYEKDPDVSARISGWNSYLQDKYGKDNSPLLLDRDSFLGEIGLDKGDAMHSGDFKDILDKYYTYRRTPKESFKEDVKDFLANYSK